MLTQQGIGWRPYSPPPIGESFSFTTKLVSNRMSSSFRFWGGGGEGDPWKALETDPEGFGCQRSSGKGAQCSSPNVPPVSSRPGLPLLSTRLRVPRQGLRRGVGDRRGGLCQKSQNPSFTCVLPFTRPHGPSPSLPGQGERGLKFQRVGREAAPGGSGEQSAPASGPHPTAWEPMASASD